MQFFDYLKRVINVAFFIATKNIRRGSLMAKLTIVLILMLTFLNLTIVGGLLNGVMKDLETTAQNTFVGEVYIEPSKGEDYIRDIEVIRSSLESELVTDYSPRLLREATLEHNYKTTRRTKTPPQTVSELVGIYPRKEASTTSLVDNVIAGTFLENDDWDGIVLGASLVEGYGSAIEAGADTLGEVSIGDKVRARLWNGSVFEFTVVGIIHTKLPTIDQRSYVQYKTLQDLSKLPENQYSEIAIRSDSPEDSLSLVRNLEKVQKEEGHYQNNIQEGEEAFPQVTADMEEAFSVINNIVGATAILIGLVTIFVIIFINVTNRRRELGLLKAQGITSHALILSYIFQALFYTIMGILLGSAVLFLFLEGYFEQNPLVTPVADGHLELSFNYLIFRVVILIISAGISGFIPAWFIIRQNTLDSILGR